VSSLQAALQIQPDSYDCWRALADQLYALGDFSGADRAYLNFVRHSARDPHLLALGNALATQRLPEAESLAREQLQRHPTDVVAMRMLAEIAGRLMRYADAESLLTRCLELAPSFNAARHNYALILHRQNKSAAALEQLDRVLQAEPDNLACKNLLAAVLAGVGEFARAIELYEVVLAKQPRQAKLWLSYGHALKTAGRQEDSVRAYRKAIEIAPSLGEAWWSLANMKTVRFGEADIQTIRHQLKQKLHDEDRWHFEFALGKALEDGKDFPHSFEHYVEGNRLRKSQIGYRAQDNRNYVERCRRLFTREFFAERAGFGSAAPDPIFIVGLPRSGSTLLEQVLASHSLVEGTMELPQLVETARALGRTVNQDGSSVYPEILAELTQERCRELGEQYLADTRIYRKTAAPFFIDKLPNNWAHVGLIQLILPHAKIIDARRHPLGCCFSAFKQHFARGQHFTYDLADVGAYYRDYVTLMAHFDAVLPGRVHRAIYEDVVEHFEAEVRRLLNHCGLPFEESCLRFYENDRAVRTASSEQVRRPIFKDALEHWRNYEPWLEPLKGALGSVLDAYPTVPPDVLDRQG
jgi:cytochrome c-type biogenesis protein CcmH/NrfG